MQKNLKSVSAKNSNTTQKNENVNLNNSILDKLNKIEIKTSIQNKKDYLYKFQQSENKISDIESKKLRSKFRHKLSVITNNILISAKQYQIQKNDAKLNELKQFLNELKVYQNDNLINQDLKVNSFYQGSEDKRKNEIEICIELFNAYIK